MTGQEFLSSYPAKLMEYTLAVAYLLVFIPFWRYVHGTPRVRPVAVPVRERVPAGATATAPGWFSLPAGLFLHPGHTWMRPSGDGLVEVGLDDFAARMLGPVERLDLPRPGAAVGQGMAALMAREGTKRVPLVSPVTGTVSEVNPAAAGGAWQREPYGAWLFKVRPAALAANRQQLFAGAEAQRWLEEAGARLAARASPELGAVLQDGGAPVHGIARELEPERWDELCHEYFQGQQGRTP
jgi:glycine cleavage system H protein